MASIRSISIGKGVDSPSAPHNPTYPLPRTSQAVCQYGLRHGPEASCHQQLIKMPLRLLIKKIDDDGRLSLVPKFLDTAWEIEVVNTDDLDAFGRALSHHRCHGDR